MKSWLPILLLLAVSAPQVPTRLDSEGQDGIFLAVHSERAVVQQICGDADGLVWMRLSDGGLYCYDGVNYINYQPNPLNPESISSRNINSIFVDSGNRVWVATQKGMELVSEDRMTVKHFRLKQRNNYFSGITEGPDGKIYAWTPQSIALYDDAAEEFVKSVDLGDSRGFTGINCAVDKDGKIWTTTGPGLECFWKDLSPFMKVPVDGLISKMLFDGKSTLYLLTGSRLVLIDTETGEEKALSYGLQGVDTESVTGMSRSGSYFLLQTSDGWLCYDTVREKLLSSSDRDFPFDFPADVSSISSLMSDSMGNLWIIYRSGGFRKVQKNDLQSPYSALFHFLGKRKIETLTFNKSHCWLILDDGNLVTYDLFRRKIVSEKSFLGYYSLPRGYSGFKMQLSSRGELLLDHPTGAQIFNLDDESIPSPSRKVVIPDDYPFFPTVVFDSEGGLWAAGSGNIYWHASIPETGKGDVILEEAGKVDFRSSINVTTATTMSDGAVVFGYSDLGPVIVNPRDGKYRVIPLPIRTDQIHISSLKEDASGNLWIGSTDWGLFRYAVKNDKTERYDFFNDLRVRNIFFAGGILYVHAESSLYRYDSEDDTFSVVWSDISEDPVSPSFFSFPNGGIVVYVQGEYRVINLQGLDDAERMKSSLHVILSTGEKVITALNTSQMKENSATIRLSSLPNNFNIAVSLIDGSEGITGYGYSINNRSVWHETLEGSMPLYGLHYGRNRISFKARSMISGNESPEYTLFLKIPRPLWQLLVLFCVMSALIALVFFWHQREEKRREAETAREEKRRQEEINMQNIDFFANISHEFRTPLTLIDGAVSSLSSGTSSQEQEKMKNVIRRNTDRMLKLVSQLLDFNKLDHDMLHLKVVMTDASSVIRRVVEQFRFGASQKDINLVMEEPEGPMLMCLDTDKMEKILYNLLSNAMKFTPPGGTVTVRTDTADPQTASEVFGIRVDSAETRFLRVWVSDTGIGIPEDKKNFIFERFAQVKATKKSGGTGIGLYFVKSLVELHHGGIIADNRKDLPEGKTGSVFSFVLPMSAASYTDAEKSASSDTNVSVEDMRAQSEYLVREDPEQITSSKEAVLVIDDDYELVYFLKSVLSPNYRVICRFDAASGYQAIEKEQPSIVISDVMMVEMDGLQLCRMVKENISICHIPVILLTAKSTVEDQIKGLGAGADAYIVKPFNKDYLLAMVMTLLENRQRLRRMFNSETKPSELDNGSLSPMDKSLMDRLYSLMESSLEDGEINVDDIAAQIGMSRTKFYAKVKALTGQTPNDFFNVYKLNRAAELLREGKYKISAIAETVGFNSASHFANLFKKQFGMLPSQYMETQSEIH